MRDHNKEVEGNLVTLTHVYTENWADFNEHVRTRVSSRHHYVMFYWTISGDKMNINIGVKSNHPNLLDIFAHVTRELSFGKFHHNKDSPCGVDYITASTKGSPNCKFWTRELNGFERILNENEIWNLITEGVKTYNTKTNPLVTARYRKLISITAV